MSKLCPFMSENMADLKAKNAPCVESCALYYRGFCSINVIAQTLHKEYMDARKATEKDPAQDCQQ